ncbi:MAG: symbB [Chlamydiia bacterium]|nr:symbB [Chlamydiia bacterium]
MKKRPIFVILLTLLIQSTLIAHSSLFPITFNESMKTNQKFDLQYSTTEPTWQLLRKLFEAYQKKDSRKSSKYLIPKLIHVVWLGKPLPRSCKSMIRSWQKFHPEWTIKIWTDYEVENFKLTNKSAFNKATNYGEKSDIWRYEILYRFGGLYVDTDFECISAFDHLHQSCEFYTGIGYGKAPELYNGLIGSIPGHPILKLCIENIKNGLGDHNTQRIIKETGPQYFTQCFIALADKFQGQVVPLPVTYLYPFPNTARDSLADHKEIKKRWLKQESLAIHYWSRSWVKK